MNRKQAIEAVGLELVEKVERENCEPTSRAYDHADGEIEWAASAGNKDCTLVAYYYTTAADAADVEANGGDWGGINWEVDHYEIF